MSELAARLTQALADRYRIERELGQGGMATVYLAEDLKHHRRVAIKVLRPELAAVMGAERFLREIETTASLHHPHILALYDSGEASGFLYYVMPFVEGESLRDRLLREKQLPLEDALKIAREVADALSYAHSRGVIHRDIKPENILLESGHAVVADFGIARAVDAAGGDRLTETGLSVGTPTYMSPEQAAGQRELDGRSDLYALGCVLYEMLAGQPPFTGPTAESVIHQHLTTEARLITALRPAVSPTIAGVLARALSKTPADRFNPVGQFADALREPTTVVAGPSRSRRGLGWAAGLAVMLVLVLGVWATRRGSTRDATAPATDQTRIVVLPFENLGESADEFFADGLTEEITARLAALPGLGVIARTSADQYKDAGKTIREIGRELNVQYVLEGSVRWQRPGGAAGDGGRGRLRVTPQLIRVTDETHVWAQVYDGDVADVFQVQANIAEQVRSALDLALGEQRLADSTPPPTANLEAYEVFLQANAEAAHANASDRNLTLALSLYERVVSLDPEFAEAWARLGTTSAQAFWFTERPEHLTRARAAAQRALTLAPDLAAGHLAQGYVHYYGERAYDRALAQFRLAQRAQPGSAEILMAIGLIQRRTGDLEAGASTLMDAAELDPRSPETAIVAGETLTWLRRFEPGLTYLNRAVALAPGSLAPYAQKAWAELRMGQRDSSEATIRRYLAQTGTTPLDLLAVIMEDVDNWIDVDLWYHMDELDRAIGHFAPSEGSYPAYHLAKAEWLRSHADTSGARAHFDSARAVAEQQVARRPNDAKAHSRLAYALAGLGRGDEALREANRAIELLPVSTDLFDGTRLVMIRADILIQQGDYDAALDDIEYLLSIPSEVTVGRLRESDYTRPLRDQPRFRRLVGER